VATLTSFSRILARRAARRALYPIIELLTLVALLTRKLARGEGRYVQSFSSQGDRRVLVIAAHPDDETIGCYGTILAHLASGDIVKVIVVTDGSGSRAGGLEPAEMAQRRGRELAEIERRLAPAAFDWLRLPEGHWECGELVLPLEHELTQFRPHVLYSPSCVDFHPEHLRVAAATAGALAHIGAGDAPLVRVYEMQVPLGQELVNLFTPLDGSYGAKAQAIACYRTQRGALDVWRRQSRYVGALYGAWGGAEAFWEMPADAFGRIMDYGDWDWKRSPFRSLTGRPLGDLVAYLKGARTRRVLRSIADIGRGPSAQRGAWRRAIKRAAKWGLTLRWRIRPPDYTRTYRIRVNGLDLVVLPTVFHPTWHFTSRFLAEECGRLLGGKASSVLEIGTGTGVVALSAARFAEHAVATDVNPQAVLCALGNAESNGLAGKVSILEGDMFAPVAGQRFDAILCNPPYLKGVRRTAVEMAYFAGENLEWISRLATEGPGYLQPGGAMYCVFGDAGDVRSLVERFEREGWSADCVARRHIPSEELSIWRFRVGGT
jgi:release factor glutamine methyltransferase